MVSPTTDLPAGADLAPAPDAAELGPTPLRSAPDAADPAVVMIDAAIETVTHASTRVRAHDRLLRRAGVSLDRAGSIVLGHLARQDGLRVGELAAILGVDAPTVTRKVQHLEREGWVQRSPDPADGRSHRLHVTVQGRQVLQRLLGARRASLAEVLGGWDLADRDTFAELLHRFVGDVLRFNETER